MAARTYDPKQVSVIVGGKIIDGFMPDSYISIARDAEMWTKVIGVDGQGTRAKTNNYAGKITISLQFTAPANTLLQALATADEQSNSGVVPFLMRDLNGSAIVTAASVWIMKLPDIAYGASITERQWVLDSDNIQMFVGGNAA